MIRGGEQEMIECIVEMLKEDNPSIKVVNELVRCKNCVGNQNGICCRGLFTGNKTKPNWYCADGIRSAFTKEEQVCFKYKTTTLGDK